MSSAITPSTLISRQRSGLGLVTHSSLTCCTTRGHDAQSFATVKNGLHVPEQQKVQRIVSFTIRKISRSSLLLRPTDDQGSLRAVNRVQDCTLSCTLHECQFCVGHEIDTVGENLAI